MSESAIRAQIKAILQGVSGIGAVHEYERFSRSLPEWFSMMTGGSPAKINGWTIHRQETRAERINNPVVERYHTFAISGIYELDDEAGSEKDFQLLLEAICTAFASNITLNSTAISSDPVQIESVDVDEYGKRLFHTAELSIRVHDREYY